MPDLDFVERACADIETATSLDDLHAKMADAAGHIGFEYTAIARHVHVQSGLLHPEIISNYPAQWHNLFKKRDYSLTNPVLAACQRHGGAIRWMDLEKIIPLTRVQREYLAETRQIGLGSGCTIASHMPDMPTVSAHFVVRDNGELKPRPFMLAILLGTAVGQQARNLWNSQLPDPAADPNERLSPRQVECIKLVARGMTSWEIASTLGISDQTVSEYITDARRRLAVSNRAQLVLKALKQGYIMLDDVVD